MPQIYVKKEFQWRVFNTRKQGSRNGNLPIICQHFAHHGNSESYRHEQNVGISCWLFHGFSRTVSLFLVTDLFLLHQFADSFFSIEVLERGCFRTTKRDASAGPMASARPPLVVPRRRLVHSNRLVTGHMLLPAACRSAARFERAARTDFPEDSSTEIRFSAWAFLRGGGAAAGCMALHPPHPCLCWQSVVTAPLRAPQPPARKPTKCDASELECVLLFRQ
jgi:hypothetical protein